jgi:hypothetical protein
MQQASKYWSSLLSTATDVASVVVSEPARE